MTDGVDWRGQLPEQDFTLSAWGSVDRPARWGGLVGYLQDNGDQEFGWVLGYDEQRFTIGLASEGAKQMTYLRGRTPYEIGRVYHVAAGYDGKQLRLYVNGELDAETDAQSGPVRYPSEAVLAVGGYRDADEHYPHTGKLRRHSDLRSSCHGGWNRRPVRSGAAAGRGPG